MSRALLRALLVALLLLVPAPVVADDDAGELDSPGLRGSDDDDDEDDEPPDEPTDEDIDEYWQEDDADEREEFLGMTGDESAGRMEESEAAAEREAEDEGEPEDIFADPDKPSPDDPYAEPDEEEEDPFADLMKDPYGTAESDAADRDDDDAPRESEMPAVLLPEAPSAPVLGKPLEEDDAADGTP